MDASPLDTKADKFPAQCGSGAFIISAQVQTSLSVPKTFEVMWLQGHKLSVVCITEKPSHLGVTTLKVSVNPNLISCV